MVRGRLPGAFLTLCVCAALALCGASASAGLVAYWPLDEAGGQVANDQTTVNNGQLGSTAGADANDPTVGQPGRPGSAGTSYGFDGTSDYVIVPDHASIGSGVRNALTLSMWLYPTTTLSNNGNTYRALEKGDAYFFLQGDGAGLGTGGQNFLIKQGNTNYVVGLKEPLAANTWHHLAATFDGATREMKIYLNGGLKNVFVAPGSQIDDDALPLRIGSDDAGKYFPGRIDETAIFDHVLSNYQIIALAQGATPNALPATPAPLITSLARTGTGLDVDAPVIVQGGFAENALSFSDRTHEWNALPAALPELVGADYVKLGNEDRSANPFRLNVGLAQPATVYLLRDNRVSGASLTAMNQWMAAYGFSDTGQTLYADESGDGSNNTLFYIHRANFPAGSVDLFQQNQGGINMYGVVAVPGQLAPNAHVYTPLGTGKTFLEQAGQAVIEAENYTARTTEGVHNWLVVPDESAGAGTTINARGGKFVQSMPDALLPGGGPTNPPSIEYQVQISTPGTYRAYLRWDGNGTNATLQGQSDSIYLDIKEIKDGAGGAADWYELQHAVNGDFSSDPWDGTGQAEVDVAGPADNAMTWNFATPGIYTIRVSMREDGSTVDALILQLSSLSAPTNPGPAESAFSNGVPITLGYSKLGGDPDAIHPLGVAGGLANGAPAFVDAPGAWQNIPPDLLGADYIRTENDDAGYGFVDYSILAGPSSYLYIFLDDRYIAAHGLEQWMLDLGLIDTGLDALLDGTQPFSIFQRGEALPAGSPISTYSLGYDLSPAYNFYGIAVADVALLFIPEPSTCALVALGVLALARKRRRDQQRVPR